MAGLISRIEDLVEDGTPSWTTTHVIARGTPRYTDKGLKGTLRYGHRVGSFLPNIQAENRMRLAADVSPDSQSATLDRIVDGLVPGSLVMLDERELQSVVDVNYDSTSIQTTFGIQKAHTMGSSVDLFGEPLQVVGVFEQPATTELIVRGRYQVLVGDKLWIQSEPDLLLSGQDYEVVATQGYQPSMQEWDSVLIFSGRLPAKVIAGSTVYLRAYPAYRSPLVYVPTVSRVPYPLGPFLLDYQSGQMTERSDPRETLSIQTFDNVGVPYEPYPVKAAKNHPVVRVSIHQSSFLWWRVLAGQMTYRTDKLVLRCDERGRAYIWTDLTPAWAGPAAWRTRVRWRSGSSVNLSYRFFPDETRLAGTGSGGAYSTVIIKMNQTSNRVALMLTGQPGAEIEMDGWNVYQRAAVGDDPEYLGEVARVQYGLVAETIGHQEWQGSSNSVQAVFPYTGGCTHSA